MIHFDSRGWRAKIGEDFSEDEIAQLGSALGSVWAAAHPHKRIYVGFDTRKTAEKSAALIAHKLAAYGLQVTLSDAPLPTPALGVAAAHDPASPGAVMVTASGAPWDECGVCLRGSDGGPVRDDFMQALERSITSQPHTGAGTYHRSDLIRSYTDISVREIRAAVSAPAPAAPAPAAPAPAAPAAPATTLNVVVDALFGSAGEAARAVISRLGHNVELIHTGAPHARAPRPRPTESQVDALTARVVERKADVGIAFDGDGDRIGVVDEQGQFVEPHLVEALLLDGLAKAAPDARLAAHGNARMLVLNQACSGILPRKAAELGLSTVSVPVGFRRIYDEIAHAQDAVLMGCEQYGGIIFPWHLMERDAIFAAGLLLQTLAEKNMPLSELVRHEQATLGRTYFRKRDIPCDIDTRERYRNLLPGMNPESYFNVRPSRISHAEGLKIEFPNGSWAMARTSRTQSLIRVRAEALSAEEADYLVDRTVAAIEDM
ncbi:MAG: hypothetical protein ACOX4F_01830 [Atopobiaceae bacterium]|jgi:phosphomannomutase